MKLCFFEIFLFAKCYAVKRNWERLESSINVVRAGGMITGMPTAAIATARPPNANPITSV
jgi:hypothetical protein